MVVLKTLFHLTFLVPLFYGKYLFAVAVGLLILSTYIKTKKFDQLLQDSRLSEKERLSFTRTRNFWKVFTFLK